MKAKALLVSSFILNQSLFDFMSIVGFRFTLPNLPSLFDISSSVTGSINIKRQSRKVDVTLHRNLLPITNFYHTAAGLTRKEGGG